MHFSKAFPLCFLSLSFLVHTVFCADPLFHFCFSQENYTSNSPYGSNLNDLASILYSQVPPTGFGTASVGQGENRANGLALCRGDVSSTNCKTCIIDANKEIRDRCPNKKGAIIWYDNCLYKFSNVEFFGKIDTSNRFYMWNVQFVDNPTAFNQRTKEFLSGLASKAYISPVLYETGEQEQPEAEKLYGLVQCTRDISRSDCKKCLDAAISEIPNCCDGKRGGRVVGGSCNFRYELYPFVNQS